MNFSLKINEWIFLTAGIFTLAAIPFLEAGGFALWLFVKAIYALGIVLLFLRK